MNKLTWLLAAASLGAVTVAGCGDDTPSLECGANTTMTDGVCVGDTGTNTTCGAGTIAMGTECVPDGSVICETGTTLDMASGTCVADITGCGTGTIVVDGVCTDPADVVADVTEAAEPNDGPDGTPGTFDLPMEGEAITISGCIEPTTDMAGNSVIDNDAYVFEASGPTLLEITVDGFNGAAGAFLLQAGDQQLVDDGYVRFGVNFANDMSKRQVFLPKAGAYFVLFGDSRSLWFDQVAGGPGACYLTTIRNVELPTPTAITVDTPLDGTFTDNTQFLRFTPSADGSIATSTTLAPNDQVAVDTVVMVNGQYVGRGGDAAFGAPANTVRAGLNTADMVTYVVDPVINLALNPVNFSHLVSEVGSTPIATDGSVVSVPTTGDPADPILDHYLSFTVANDDDVVFLDLDATGLNVDPADVNVDWLILDSNLNPVSDIGNSNGLSAGHYQFAQAGTYFIEIRDNSTNSVTPFNFVSTQIDHTPTPIVVDTPVLAQSFGVDKAAFYSVTPGAFEWWNLTGTPTSFDGDMLLGVFAAGQPGKLGQEVGSLATITLIGGEDNVQLLDNSPALLLMVRDNGATAPGTYDFSVANNPYTDLGFVDVATPAADTVTAAVGTTYYLAQGNDGDVFNTLVSGSAGFDPELASITGDGETVIDVNVGADTAESSVAVLSNGRAAFAVRDAGVAGGDFTVDVTLLPLASAPSAPISNALPAVQDVIVAAACTIVSLDVDINITHTWIGDIQMTLTSPLGTAVLLHDGDSLGFPEGSFDDIIGNYDDDHTVAPDPINRGDLMPAESTNAFVGEEAMGNWTLDIADTANGDDGSLVYWILNMVCS